MILRAALLLTSALAVGGTAYWFDRPQASAVAKVTAPPEPPLKLNPAAREALFGDLHLHTAYSFDAWAFGQGNLGPDEAYRFAKGEPVNLLGTQIRRNEPLDFMAVTDHSEYMGVLNQLDDPNNPLSHDPATEDFREHRFGVFVRLFQAMHGKATVPDINAAQGVRDAWVREVAAANANYQPGRFTTFIGYEWSSMPDGIANLHRNVIFGGDHAPQPFTSIDSDRPEDLWAYLERSRRGGTDAIAIPHNGNASGGLMYDWVDSDRRPISEAYAQTRATNEPLTEIYQTKGSSETHPTLSPNDEYAGFEKWDTFLADPRPSSPPGSYIRDALGRGLLVQKRTGANPYHFGFTGSADIHNALSASAENATSGVFAFDPNANMPDRAAVEALLRLQAPRKLMEDKDAKSVEGGTRYGSAGLTGVWAEQNSRSAIFAALKRRETFATSGTKLKLRFFAGWNYPRDLLAHKDWAKAAYANGVPMGSDLAAAPARASAPAFLLWAVKDPHDANLDRIQVVKVWLDGGAYREKVFDVAWSGARKPDPRTGKVSAVGNTVDLKTAAYANTIGAPSLQTVWRDPEFDATRPAVYYARVLQIPTPRWTTYLAVKRGVALPDSPATIQERGWSSPIWYNPRRAS